mmetsp:Transcript_17541/g.49817  ORF Transcript_17541/g.49817 Transcript_17541/m.49817 type:complete len:382 (-) Transcript_17541:375-1520(-)
MERVNVFTPVTQTDRQTDRHTSTHHAPQASGAHCCVLGGAHREGRAGVGRCRQTRVSSEWGGDTGKAQAGYAVGPLPMVGVLRNACPTCSWISFRNSSPHVARNSSPACLPMLTASCAGPSLSTLMMRLPSGDAISPLNLSRPSGSTRACPAMGVRQLPSSCARKARSQSTHLLVSGQLSASIHSRICVSSLRHCMPMAPCATAGRTSSLSTMLVASPSMLIRFRPASASMVASTSPASSFFSLVCTLPLKLTTLSVGLMARICACRRSDADPTTEPSGNSLMVFALREMKTSRVSSLGRLHASTVPSGRYVGTSFIECTQMSTSFASSATSSSLVKRPLPPISAKAMSSLSSPVVLMILSSTAPSSANSGKASPNRRFVS